MDRTAGCDLDTVTRTHTINDVSSLHRLSNETVPDTWLYQLLWWPETKYCIVKILLQIPVSASRSRLPPN